MPERKFGIDLKSYDDIFKTEEEREEDRLSKIRDIPISEIDDFPDHPFMVRDDEDMQNLIANNRIKSRSCFVHDKKFRIMGQRTGYLQLHLHTF